MMYVITNHHVRNYDDNVLRHMIDMLVEVSDGNKFSKFEN